MISPGIGDAAYHGSLSHRLPTVRFGDFRQDRARPVNATGGVLHLNSAPAAHQGTLCT